MPPPSDSPALNLSVLEGEYFVLKLDSKTGGIDEWVSKALQPTMETRALFSITRTDEEISIVGRLGEHHPQICREHATWRAIKIAGPLDFGLTGIMASLTAPLKLAGVPVFVLSTWNTDYLLINQGHFLGGLGALKQDGWTFEGE